MLEEILLNHKKTEFVHSRVEVTNQQREIEKQKRLANMKNIEWGKSKMKRNSPLAAPESRESSSDGIFKHDIDHNDNDCKLKDQMMVNPSLIIPFGTSLKLFQFAIVIITSRTCIALCIRFKLVIRRRQ